MASHTNRLANETSPYLLQHAHNPVDWYPWGAEALQKAKEENKVILVSIGYSACHWCHVMERESFENEEVAAIMNRYFINIKIDREERPDLDQVYMDAVQTMSGSGGWPLNCFLTPGAKPFYGGTYFPPVNAYNRSSWTQVLHAIQSAWTEKPEEIIAQAENLTNHLSKSGLFGNLESPDNGFSQEQQETISQNLQKNGDTVWGGFGHAPKFPQTFCIQFLLRQEYYAKAKSNQKPGAPKPEDKSPATFKDGALALLSLDRMIYGGIYDQLGGGFARYSTDARWLAPHFEKMLYDNALLIGAMSEAFQLTRLSVYRHTIEQTMQFVAQEWQDSDGGFFSAYDADSEGEEGKYYTWQWEEVRQLLPEQAYFEVFTKFYGMEPDGNWEHTNILWIKTPLVDFCNENNLELIATEEILQECRNRLLQVRQKRVKPLLDDKKLLGWNALMVTACCKAWAALGHDSYLEMAEKSAAFIEAALKKDGGYCHNYKEGRAANPAFLDDLAYYIQALCHLQECTGNFGYLETARTVTEGVLAAFVDEETGFFYFTPANQTDIIFRKKDMYDGATPSGNSIMAANLLYLGTLLDIPAWKEQSADMLGQMLAAVVKYPSSFAVWAQLLQYQLYGLREVAVIGKEAGAFAKSILSQYFPNMVLQQASGANGKYPLLYGRTVLEDETLAYVCRNFACQRPVSTIAEILEEVN